MRLRLTRQALADLDLPIDELCVQDARSYADLHEVVAKFVQLRGASPVGQESTRLPVTRQTVWNLHAGRWRGLTWHDEEDDVVWLLGVGWHESGSRDDAYVVLRTRDEAGDLFPTVQDYEDTEPNDVEAFLDALQQSAPDLMAQAVSAPGTEVRGRIATSVDVALLIELVVIEGDQMREVWVGISMPPSPPPELVLPPEWQMYLLAALLPQAPFDDLEWGRPFPREGGTRQNEVVVAWLDS